MVRINPKGSLSISKKKLSLMDHIKTFSKHFNTEGFQHLDNLEVALNASGLNYFVYNTTGTIRTNTRHNTLEGFSDAFNMHPVTYTRKQFTVMERSLPIRHALIVNPIEKQGLRFLCIW